jgi:hypothetical protein
LRLALDDAVRVVDRGRHQFRGFVAGVAEHQALVAGALLQVNTAPSSTPWAMSGLLVVGDQHGAALVVDAEVGVVVADALDGFAGDSM